MTLTTTKKKVANWLDSEKIGISTTLENEKGEEIIVIVEEYLPQEKSKMENSSATNDQSNPSSAKLRIFRLCFRSDILFLVFSKNHEL